MTDETTPTSTLTSTPTSASTPTPTPTPTSTPKPKTELHQDRFRVGFSESPKAIGIASSGIARIATRNRQRRGSRPGESEARGDHGDAAAQHAPVRFYRQKYQPPSTAR